MTPTTTPNSPSFAHPNSAPRLNGWQAIADCLGRDRTTAIRWAQDRGLPVHRIPGGKRASVFAYAAELDRWINSARAREADPGNRDSTGVGRTTDKQV